jgi:Xaa-Pro dipeptidase
MALQRSSASKNSYPRFSKAEYSSRYKALRELLQQHSLSAVIISGGQGNVGNIYYWTNYLPKSTSYFLTTGQSGTLLVGNYNHIPTAKSMSIVYAIKWATHFQLERIGHEMVALSKVAGKRIGVIGNISYEILDGLKRKLDCKLVHVTKNVNEIRSVKSREEIEWLNRGAEFTDRAMKALESESRIGMSEFEISNIVERSYVPLGGTTRIHYIGTTSMRNPRVCVPSQNPTARKLRKGDIIITELSAEYAGYAGQIHRPISVGQSPTEEYENLYGSARDAYEAVLDSLVDGAISNDLVSAANDSIVNRGYTIYDCLIHGYGTDYMLPELGTTNSAYDNPKYVYKENMAIVIQPNPISKNKRSGLQLGNLCLVGKRKSHSLQKFPMKFVSIE